MTRHASLPVALAVSGRIAMMTLFWWLLAEGRWDSPVAAALIIVAAAGASLLLQPPSARRFRVLRLAALVAYFVRQSLLGGIDVSRRALSPALPLRPGLIRFEFSEAPGLPRVLFALMVTLTPGTASVRLEATHLVVHVLDTDVNVGHRLRGLEERMAAVFSWENIEKGAPPPFAG